MNHDWPPEVHKAMIAVDHVTPESPDLSLIAPRPSPQRSSSHRVLAVAVVVVVTVVGGLAYVISRDDRDATSPSDTIAEPPSPTSASTDSACSLLGDTGLIGAAATSVIDHLLTSNPAALETAALQQCKDATADQLRRLQAMVLERRAVLDTSTTAEPSAEPTWQRQLAGERVQVTAAPDPASTVELPSLQIDAGAVNGITVGSAVINDKGLVGRVQRVDDRTSTVELVTSTTFQAYVRPAAGSASDVCAGVVTGSGTGKAPFVTMLDAGGATAAPAGDLVVTADVSHLLPAGIPVGTITSFTSNGDGGSCAIEWLAGGGDPTHLTVVLTVPPPLDGVPAGSVSTTVTETSAPSPSVSAVKSLELGSGTLRYIVPLDASVDPSRWPNVPAEVIGYAYWLTDCCLLKVVVESIDPPRPANEVVETFSAGGLDWTVYDSEPGDGTAMIAQATGDFGTVLISAQSSSPQQGVAHDVVVSLARTVTFTPNA